MKDARRTFYSEVYIVHLARKAVKMEGPGNGKNIDNTKAA